MARACQGRVPPRREPPEVAEAFDKDPIGAARLVLMREVNGQAAAGFEGQPAIANVRKANVASLLHQTAPDAGVRHVAANEQWTHSFNAAHAPSGDLKAVAAKLALLVRELAFIEISDPQLGRSLLHFTLASAALADLVILGERPLNLPHRAAEPILDQADVDFWRARAGRTD